MPRGVLILFRLRQSFFVNCAVVQDELVDAVDEIEVALPRT
jgi:hypothetical protein